MASLLRMPGTDAKMGEGDGDSMISQANCTAVTPMGANLVSEIGVPGGGATFRAWAPRATAVYVNGVFGGVSRTGQSPDLLMVKDANGYWSGFLAEAGEGDSYQFYVVGAGSSGYKRDPYARELANDPAAPFPVCPAVIRAASAYPWHDAGFAPPGFSDMVIYQLHIGTYTSQATGRGSTFLDVIEKLEYLVALGVNVVQPLPVWGNEDNNTSTNGSLGYDGSDYFSPEIEYGVYDPALLAAHLVTINRLLAARGFAPIALADITPAYAQLKAMVDLLHVYGIAVAFDVVYNHAGGWGDTYTVPASVAPGGTLNGDDESLYFWDRAVTNPNGVYDNNQSLYFTDQGYVGGLSFALWNADVCGYLRNNASFYLDEMHGDGFRYDEISMLLAMNGGSGWDFVRGLTGAVRALKPAALQNAEYWPGEYFNQPATEAVTPAGQGGMGFDAVQHDALREAIRSAVTQAANGASATVELSGIAMAAWPTGFAQAWQTIPCVENHDIVKMGTSPRIPALADGSDHRSWYARSRSRVASALLLAAPGIPQLFMGQEFLEDKQWGADPTDASHLIWWGGLIEDAAGKAADGAMADHLRFTQDAVRLRMSQPALRGEGLNVFYTSDGDRVIAFQRWVEGAGQDVVVVATLNESTWWNYQLGFPSAGRWVEVFNSDAYDSCNANGVSVNPQVAGNAGGVTADGPPLHNLPASATVVIPANGVVIFAKG
jgi:1,4-alpha-glucan branching enzyme